MGSVSVQAVQWNWGSDRWDSNFHIISIANNAHYYFCKHAMQSGSRSILTLQVLQLFPLQCNFNLRSLNLLKELWAVNHLVNYLLK